MKTLEGTAYREGLEYIIYRTPFDTFGGWSERGQIRLFLVRSYGFRVKKMKF